MPSPTLQRLFPGAFGLLLLAACGTAVVNPVSGRAERSVMDEPAEIAAGRNAHQQVLAETGALANPKLQAYVNEVGQKLARQSHRAKLQWTFTVLDSPEINAFALPGGFVYVTRGILAYLDSEADLAGVIGHEIGHVTARHGAQRATSQHNAGIGVLAATVLGVLVEGVTGVSGAAQAAGQIGQGVAAGRLASYSRDQESQADQLGAEYLARSRYNPRSMVDVIQVLKNQERFAADQAKAEGRAAPAGTSWLASHPSNDKRLADIQQVAAGYSGSYDDDGKARYLQAIEGLPFGESSQQGLTRGRNFYHDELGFALSAPVGWQVRNSTAAIMLVNGAGDAGLIVRLLPACRRDPRGHHPHARQAHRRAAGKAQLQRPVGEPLRRHAPQRTGPGAGRAGVGGHGAGQPQLPDAVRVQGRCGAAASRCGDAGGRVVFPCPERRRPCRCQALGAAQRGLPAGWFRRTGAQLAAGRAGRGDFAATQRRLRRRAGAQAGLGREGGAVAATRQPGKPATRQPGHRVPVLTVH